MTEPKKDYIAVIRISAGGSFARGPDRHDVVARALKIAKSDWKTLFQLDGARVNVEVFDVTGHDEVWWDHEMHDSKTQEVIPLLEVIETHFPGRKAKARA